MTKKQIAIIYEGGENRAAADRKFESGIFRPYF